MAKRKKHPLRTRTREKPDPGHFHSDDPRQRGLLAELAASEEVSIVRVDDDDDDDDGEAFVFKGRITWMVERKVVAGVLCQRQFVRCGKQCWCMKAAGPPFHGPYWYAYTFNKRGRVRCTYIGKSISAKRVRAAIA